APPFAHTHHEVRRVNDFLVKDYELKVRYLTDHFSRMWTRFNYFVGIESALAGGKFIVGSGGLPPQLAVIGALVSLVWYVMGAEDRLLVQVYRGHVAEAAARVMQAAGAAAIPGYRHVGEVSASAAAQPMSVTAWRLEAVSTTRLAAWIPL